MLAKANSRYRSNHRTAGNRPPAIWASFAFRFSPFSQNDPVREVWDERWQDCLSDHTALENMVAFTRDHHLLPEAYLYGFVFTSERAVNKNMPFRPAFLDGEWSNTGFNSFFPRAFLYKTPIPLLLLLIMAGIAAFLRWRNVWKNGGRSAIGRDLRRLSPIWALVLVYGTFSLTSHLNIGHRHLLPIYPAIFIACGACTYFFRAQSGKAVAIFAGAMMCWQIIESSLLRPDYLSYFNQVADGPKNGYKHLVDSSLDWGQDLPALKSWLDYHPMHLPPTDFTLPTSAPPCRGGMGLRRRHSRSILPLQKFRRIRTGNLLYQRNYSSAGLFLLRMENGPTNMNQLTALLWRGRSSFRSDGQRLSH